MSSALPTACVRPTRGVISLGQRKPRAACHQPQQCAVTRAGRGIGIRQVFGKHSCARCPSGGREWPRTCALTPGLTLTHITSPFFEVTLRLELAAQRKGTPGITAAWVRLILPGIMGVLEEEIMSLWTEVFDILVTKGPPADTKKPVDPSTVEGAARFFYDQDLWTGAWANGGPSVGESFCRRLYEQFLVV